MHHYCWNIYFKISLLSLLALYINHFDFEYNSFCFLNHFMNCHLGGFRANCEWGYRKKVGRDFCHRPSVASTSDNVPYQYRCYRQNKSQMNENEIDWSLTGSSAPQSRSSIAKSILLPRPKLRGGGKQKKKKKKKGGAWE